MIRAGLLDERVEIEEATETRDSYGQVERSWSTRAYKWAKVRSPSAREREIEEGAQRREIDWLVEIRQDRTITSGMRVRWAGRTLHVEGVTEDRRDGQRAHRLSVLQCRERGVE